MGLRVGPLGAQEPWCTAVTNLVSTPSLTVLFTIPGMTTHHPLVTLDDLRNLGKPTSTLGWSIIILGWLRKL